MARVVAALDGGSPPHQRALVVSGERGMGRTSVADRAMVLLDSRPLRLLGLPCQATGPYTSLVHALGPAAAHPLLGDAVSGWLDVLAAAGTATPPDLARELLVSLVTTETPRPLFLLVDDAHHFDSLSRQVVAYLAQHGPGMGLCTLLTVAEPSEPTVFTPLPRLRLRPLAVDRLRGLLEAHHRHPFPFRVARTLHRWSGGNPALALDLSSRLSEAERTGTSPVGLPLVPSVDLVQRLGDGVTSLPPGQMQLLALFALQVSLPVELLTEAAGVDEAVLDTLVSQQWLELHQRVVEPRRRLDAMAAWASLTPSTQADLFLRLAATLRPTAPAKAGYFAAQGGSADAERRLVERSKELYAAGEPELAAATGVLALTRRSAVTGQDSSLLAELLIADGYIEAAAEQLTHAEAHHHLSEAVRLSRRAELAAMTGDLAGALAHLDVTSPPAEGLDDWLRAALMTCRVQLALDGPDNNVTVSALRPALPSADPEVAALAEVVAAERALHDQQPDSPAALRSALELWLRHRKRGFDLAAMSAVVDLLGLGQLAAGRDLLATAGPAVLATTRTALLTLRIEIETAAGQFRRAATLLTELDRERPNVTGVDLLTSSQAIRIGAVCPDLPQCGEIERRLSQNPTGVMTYPARRAHSAALGFRELVHGNYAASRSQLSLALQGPALLMQGRAAVLADLVEATVADGDPARAAQLLEHHSDWLPDRYGDRTAGLLARCRALTAAPDELDERFGQAFALLTPTQEVGRARTLLAHGRALIYHGRSEAAVAPLEESLSVFSESRLPGWERHVRRLLTADSRSADVRLPSSALTDMEQRVLALVLQRKRNREIAATLFVSLRTVESHLTRIFGKFGVSTKSELFRRLPRGPG